MIKYALAAITGVALTGNVYMAGWGAHPMESGMDNDCCAVAPDAAPAVAPIPASLMDMKNSKCIVMDQDIGASQRWVEYQGKAYHICCGDCIAEFNKDPQKFVKALEAKPEAFGIKQ